MYTRAGYLGANTGSSSKKNREIIGLGKMSLLYFICYVTTSLLEIKSLTISPSLRYPICDLGNKFADCFRSDDLFMDSSTKAISLLLTLHGWSILCEPSGFCLVLDNGKIRLITFAVLELAHNPPAWGQSVYQLNFRSGQRFFCIQSCGSNVWPPGRDKEICCASSRKYLPPFASSYCCCLPPGVGIPS